MASTKESGWWRVEIPGTKDRGWLIASILGVLIAAILGVLIAAIFAWLILPTPREKRAALLALEDIEAIRNFSGVNGVTYQARVLKTGQAVKQANAVALTLRDQEVCSLLETDFASAKARRVISLLSNEKLADMQTANGREKKLEWLAQQDNLDRMYDTKIKDLLRIKW